MFKAKTTQPKYRMPAPLQSNVGARFNCTQCQKRFQHKPFLLPGCTFYNMHDKDVTQFEYMPGEPDYKTGRILSRLDFEESWKKNRYSPIHGKVFHVWFPYCSRTCLTGGKTDGH